MRKIIFVALLAIFAVTNAGVVKVDNLPENTFGNKIRLIDVKTAQALDSAIVTGRQAVLRSDIADGRWCNIGYSYPIEGGVRTDYAALFMDCDTVSIDLADGALGVKIDGGVLNHKSAGLNEAVKKLAKSRDGKPDIAGIGRLFIEETQNNADNSYGAYVLSMGREVIADSVWLEIYNTLGADNRDYPSLLRTQNEKQNRIANATGRRMADLTVVTASGDTTRLWNFIGHGKYVLVDFWASWCGPCRREAHETLEPLYEKYKDDDRFMILGVVTSEKPADSVAVAANAKYPWTQIADIDNMASSTFGFSSIPQIMLVGPDGTLLYRGIRGQAIFDAVAGCLR